MHVQQSAYSTSAILSSIGVSRWYASRIRQGYRPHPRHRQSLALVGFSPTCKFGRARPARYCQLERYRGALARLSSCNHATKSRNASHKCRRFLRKSVPHRISVRAEPDWWNLSVPSHSTLCQNYLRGLRTKARRDRITPKCLITALCQKQCTS